MCSRENLSLQRGMNFRCGHNHSVILMSLRPNAPYADRFIDEGTTLVYEGHDVPMSASIADPKSVDQPMRTPNGSLTQNGLFYEAALRCKQGLQSPERVRVYEKIKPGIWAYNGMFHLIDSWMEQSENRGVFKFKLVAVEGEENFDIPVPKGAIVRRLIPTSVKLEVWKRDGGKCSICSAVDNLHFDHIIPWSKGGSSETAENVQLLCSRHNLEKRDNIE